MKDKAPAVQWYPKQYLGDDKVLAMDWDARGMHHWLLNISWQQVPVGSIPDDMGTVRRWLGLPSGFADADRVWARVWSQISVAWALDNGRWFNAGMVRAWERQQIYRQNASKRRANSEQIAEDEVEEEVIKKRKSFEPPSLGEVSAYCQGRQNNVAPQQWFDYYTSNGWKVGRNSMKDWRAAVRTWERNGKVDAKHEQSEARRKRVEAICNEPD